MNHTMQVQSLVLLAFLCSACGASDTVEPDAQANCSADPRAHSLSLGMTIEGDDQGGYLVIESMAPTAPERFGNLWSVLIQNSAGVAIEGASIEVFPFMPDHGHGTPQPPEARSIGDPGRFELGPFDLWMPGIWELHWTIAHESASFTALLVVCIEE